MSRRSTARRNVRRRGVLPSFGDMILPVVGVAAVGLLIIAGRQFFLNGFKTSPGISSTRAYAESPALIAERENKLESEMLLPSVSTDAAKNEIEKNENDKANEHDDFIAMAVAVQAPAPQASPHVKLQTSKTQNHIQTSKKISSKSTSSSVVMKTKTKSAAEKSNSSSSSKQWRVQIGAYTSRSGAQEAVKKINKAGYKATIYQNPASKHFKVWVQGGASKSSAEKVAQAMQKIGYKGSFAFPPAK